MFQSVYASFRGSDARKSLVALRRALTSGLRTFAPGVALESVAKIAGSNSTRLPPMPASPFINVAGRQLFSGHSERETQRRAYRLEGGFYLDPRTGFALTRTGRVVRNSTDGLSRERLPNMLSVLTRPRVEEQRVLSMLHRYSTNYFHFLVIIAPRLIAAERCGVPIDVPVVLDAALTQMPVFKAAVERGLLGGRRVIAAEKGTVIATETLYVVHDDDCFAMMPEVARRFSTQRATQPARAILLTRGKSAANGRRILNEAALVEALAPLGVEAVDPATLDFAAQIELAASTQLLISPHGAGLTNLTFMAKGTHVIELFSPSLLNDCYAQLAATLGISHSALVFPDTGQGPKSNMTIDVEAVATTVASVLEKRRQALS